jgi:hypothetical protein
MTNPQQQKQVLKQSDYVRNRSRFAFDTVSVIDNQLVQAPMPTHSQSAPSA